MTTAIVGVGETDVGFVPTQTSLDLYVECIESAVADAGRDLVDIDCLITMNSRTDPRLYHAEYVAEYLGIRPSMAYTLQTGGGTTVSAVMQAMALLETGRVETVVLAAADNIRTGLGSGGTVAHMASDVGHPEFEAPYGPTVPAMYALVARRHMHAYGTTRAQLAAVAVAMRKHGALNSRAQLQAEVSIDDVLCAPMIADPLGKLDCALISDGGAAVMLAAAEPGSRVVILGCGEGHDYEYISQAASLTTTAATASAERAFRDAGLDRASVDVAFLYDAFTILPVLFVEDLGFCEKGDGGAFVDDGNLELGGLLPTNPHGGLLSFGHPGRSGAMFMVTEAVRQLRGETGRRQVPDAKVALVHAEGGVASSHGTLLMGVAP